MRTFTSTISSTRYFHSTQDRNGKPFCRPFPPKSFPMLVSRQHDSEQNHWSMSKYETLYHKPASSPRMSHHYDAPLSTQSDWQGQQYSFLPPGVNPYTQSYGHGQPSSGSAGSQAQPRSAADASGAMDIDSKSDSTTMSPPLSHHRSADPLGLRAHRQPSPITEHPENRGEMYAQKAAESAHEGSLASADTGATSMTSNPIRSGSTTGPVPERSSSKARSDCTPCKQEEDDDLLDDEDMEGEGDSTHEMTPAERTAARRKMKRFRCVLKASPRGRKQS